MHGMFDEYGSPAIDRKWMWTLRLATLVLFLLLLCPAVYTWFAGENHLNSFLLLAIMYGGLLWALRENPPGKATLAAALSMSVFPLAVLSLSIAYQLYETTRGFARMVLRWEEPWGLLTLLQLVILASALAAFVGLTKKTDVVGAMWTLRIAALVSILLLLRPLRWNAWATWEFGYLGYLWTALWQLAGVLLNGVVLWSLRREPAELSGEARSALLLAGGTGACLFLYSLGKSLAQVFVPSGSPGAAQGSALPAILSIGGFVVANGVLAGAAIRVYYKLGRKSGDVATLVKALFLGCLCWVVFITMVSGELRREHGRGRGNESSAVGSLRTINTGEVMYASTYGKGFSPTLAAIGPPAQGGQPSADAADLIDSVLASGQKSGYNFIYTPGPRDAQGSIPSYTVAARPATPDVSGQRKFFTDQTGVIRATLEERPATAADPPI